MGQESIWRETGGPGRKKTLHKISIPSGEVEVKQRDCVVGLEQVRARVVDDEAQEVLGRII